MKLFDSTSSPFVRKVNVAIHLLGLGERIERLGQHAHPIERDENLVRHNPLGQVPTLVLEDGRVLCDSRVICQYLNELVQGDLFPREAARLWQALTWQALADGLLDAALLLRYEAHTRPAPLRWSGWEQAQWAKIDSVLKLLEEQVAGWGDGLDIGAISCVCALGYLDFRFPERPWQASCPAAARWYARIVKHPVFAATHPRPRT